MIGTVMAYICPSYCTTKGAAVSQDAERLILAYGEQAYETAGVFSWREDIGLLFSRHPGHWHRVKLEIGRRTGREPLGQTDLEPDIQALHLI